MLCNQIFFCAFMERYGSCDILGGLSRPHHLLRCRLAAGSAFHLKNPLHACNVSHFNLILKIIVQVPTLVDPESYGFVVHVVKGCLQDSDCIGGYVNGPIYS